MIEKIYTAIELVTLNSISSWVILTDINIHSTAELTLKILVGISVVVYNVSKTWAVFRKKKGDGS